MRDFIYHPENERYIKEYRSGDAVFLEGDENTDLFVLISGQIILLKGNMRIAEITEAGSVFGEMAYLLSESRSASAKVVEDTKVLCIPGEEITAYMNRFPLIAPEMTSSAR